MSFSVTILGSASAKPTPDRHPSAQIVKVHEQHYLVDAGEGAQQQMFRYGINPLKLRAVFISHLHGDHVFGLFPLISTLGLYGRRTPLKIFGPAPLGEMLGCHLRYFDTQLPYEIEWVEVDTTRHALLFENRTLEVWSIPLRHRIPTSGYLFREKQPPLNVRKEKITEYGLSIARITAAKRGEDILLDNGDTLPNAELTYRPHVHTLISRIRAGRPKRQNSSRGPICSTTKRPTPTPSTRSPASGATPLRSKRPASPSKPAPDGS